MQNGRFSSIIELRLKKVCYKVSLCENCQRKHCRAFIGLTIHAKIIVGGRPLLPEILGQSDRVGSKSPIFDLQGGPKKTGPFLKVYDSCI